MPSIGRLTERGPITIRSLVLESGGPPVEARAVDASPGLIALAAVLGGFGPPPDFVVSGANLGANTGHSILHSGTVGAVLTAQNFGVSGMAVSMEEPTAASPDARPAWYLDAMCAMAVPVFEWLCEAPRPTALNLNVPAAEVDQMGQLCWAPLDQFGTVRVSVESTTAGLQFEFRQSETQVDPESDTALLTGGHPTLTSLAGLAVAEPGSGIRRPLQVGSPPHRADVADRRVVTAAVVGPAPWVSTRRVSTALDRHPRGQAAHHVTVSAAEPVAGHVDRSGGHRQAERVERIEAPGLPCGQGGGHRIARTAVLDDVQRRDRQPVGDPVQQGERRLVAARDHDRRGAVVAQAVERGERRRFRRLLDVVVLGEVLVAHLHHLDAAGEGGVQLVTAQVGDDAHRQLAKVERQALEGQRRQHVLPPAAGEHGDARFEGRAEDDAVEVVELVAVERARIDLDDRTALAPARLLDVGRARRGDAVWSPGRSRRRAGSPWPPIPTHRRAGSRSPACTRAPAACGPPRRLGRRRARGPPRRRSCRARSRRSTAASGR